MHTLQTPTTNADVRKVKTRNHGCTKHDMRREIYQRIFTYWLFFTGSAKNAKRRCVSSAGAVM